jgi:hypothetical protein
MIAMRKFALTILSSLFFPVLAFSQGGGAGFQILEIGYSARNLALANSNDVVTDDPVAIFTNPAGLAANETGIGLNFMVTHRTYFAGTTVDMFGTRFEGAGLSFGTSILYSNVPDIEVRATPSDDPQSTFAAKDFAFAFGIARNFDKLDVGISAMYLYEKLFVYESTGYALNLGARYSPIEDVELGLSAGNLGSSSAMISQKITLPAFVRLGGSYTKTLDDNFALTGYLDATSFKSGGITPGIGAEFSFQNLLKLRAGYSSGNEISGYSFGAGINYNFLRFDYSYIPYKLDFGNSQTFTLSFMF